MPYRLYFPIAYDKVYLDKQEILLQQEATLGASKTTYEDVVKE